MAINDLSVLISTEQDVKFANKEQAQQSSTEDTQSSASDFFTQLQSANSAVEESDKKNNTTELQVVIEGKNSNSKSANKSEQEPVISGDEMLAQINAANKLDTSVISASGDKPTTSVIDLLDKYTQEKLTSDPVKAKATGPIDAVTPIVDMPLEEGGSEGADEAVTVADEKAVTDMPLKGDINTDDDPKLTVASDKTAIAEAIDRQLKRGGGSEGAVTTNDDNINTEKAPMLSTSSVSNQVAADIKDINNNKKMVAALDSGKSATEYDDKQTLSNADTAKTPPNLDVDKSKVVAANSNENDEKSATLMQATAVKVDSKTSEKQPSDMQAEVKSAQAKTKTVSDDIAVNSVNKEAVTPTLTSTAQTLKEAVTAAETVVNVVPKMSTESATAIAKSPEINQAVNALLNSNGSEKDEPILASLSQEQRSKLQIQVDSIATQGATPQSVSALKQTIAQLIVNNSSEEHRAKNATQPSEKISAGLTHLSDEIANLTAPEKQALLKQLQQFVVTEKPQGAVLKQVNTAIAELETKQLPPSAKEPQLSTPILTNTQTESVKSQPEQSTLIKKAAPEQTVKPDVQQNIAKEQFVADVENSEQSSAREPMTMRTNQLFSQITNLATTPLTTEGNEVIEQRYQQQLADMQVLNAQQTNSTSQAKQINVDPTLLQALNIVKSDAAKVLQERVSALLSINNKEAEIRLDPPEMGSMQIRIRSDAEQAQINFVVQNQQAKEALEQSMPKLREMLAEQGIELGESSIQQGDSQHKGDENEQQSGQGQLANNSQTDEEVTGSGSTTTNTGQQSSSSIDYYA